MPIIVPYLGIDEIVSAADSVLREHQPGGGIPVEIEEIIEFGFEIEIRPIKALHARFAFEGAMSYDLATIYVDETVMTQFANRYRFTPAHELGHKVLHSDIIEQLEFGSLEAWKSSIASIAPGPYGKLEFQAYLFAGHLLVPAAALRTSCDEATALAAEHGIDLAAMGAAAISHVEGRIAKEFRVSTAVMERRIRDERLFE